MKLNKKLSINGVKAALESEKITLRYMAAGTAIFQVRTGDKDEPPGGEVEFSLGWNFQNTLIKYFCGDITLATEAGKGLFRLLCRERAARLDEPHPLALRHPTLKEVIKAYAARTGIDFIVPERPYSTRRIPAFYALGSGFHGINSLGDAFGVPDYFWQTQGDGKVFAGSFADSNWTGKMPAMPESFFSGATANGKRTVSAIPALRPGVILNGERVKEILFSGHEMVIQSMLSG